MAAQAGIQASLLARESYVEGDSDEDDYAIEQSSMRIRRSTHLDPKTQTVAATLSKDMTENSNLFKLQKERAPETVGVSANLLEKLTFDGHMSFKFDLPDIEEKVRKSSPNRILSQRENESLLLSLSHQDDVQFVVWTSAPTGACAMSIWYW
jgi:hypothetical protein